MDSPQPSDAVPLVPPGPPPMSLAGRMMNIIAGPGEVFDQVKATPPCAANWLVPALILIAVSWLGVAIVFSQDSVKLQLREKSEQAIQKQMEKLHKSQAETERAQEMGTKVAVIVAVVLAFVAPVLAAFALPFWAGLVVWLGAKVFHGPLTYMKAVEAAGLINVVGVLEAIVRPLLIIGFNNLYASPSLALLVKDYDPQNPAHAALAVANAFSFWLLVLRSFALKQLTGVSAAKSVLWVFGIWAALVAFGLGMSVAFRAITPH